MGGKIRSKDVKKTGNGGDFKKKKVKVGRKVKRSNVTEIKVQSRRINIPLQSQTSAEHKSSHDPEVTKQLIRQLHHHNELSRLSALEDVKRHLSDQVVAKAQIALILPDAMELLFHEEKDTRTAVVNLFSFLTATIASDYFLSVLPVIITYICSGLTHVHKGVRKDSLMLLHMFSESHAHLLLPYKEKLTMHAVSLLNDPTSATTGAAAIDFKGGGGGGGGGNATSTGSNTSSFSSFSSSSSSSHNPEAKRPRKDESVKQTNAASSKSTVFVLVLKVLHSLLSISSSSSTRSSNNTASHPYSLSASASAGISLSEGHNGSVLILQSKRNECYILSSVHEPPDRNNKNTSISSTVNVNMAGTAHELTISTATDLCSRLQHIWKGLVMGSSSISMDAIIVCREIVSIILGLQSSSEEEGSATIVGSPVLRSLISTIMTCFPYKCRDAELSVPGSQQELNGKLAVEILNIALCEVSVHYCSTVQKLLANQGYDGDFENDDNTAATGTSAHHGVFSGGKKKNNSIRNSFGHIAAAAKVKQASEELVTLESTACGYLLQALAVRSSPMERKKDNNTTGREEGAGEKEKEEKEEKIECIEGKGPGVAPSSTSSSSSLVSTWSINAVDSDTIVHIFAVFDLIFSVGSGLSTLFLEQVLQALLSLYESLEMYCTKRSRIGIRKIYFAAIRCTCHVAQQTMYSLGGCNAGLQFSYTSFSLLVRSLEFVVKVLPPLIISSGGSLEQMQKQDATTSEHQALIQQVIHCFLALTHTHDALFSDMPAEDVVILSSGLEAAYFDMVGATVGGGASDSDDDDDNQKGEEEDEDEDDHDDDQKEESKERGEEEEEDLGEGAMQKEDSSYMDHDHDDDEEDNDIISSNHPQQPADVFSSQQQQQRDPFNSNLYCVYDLCSSESKCRLLDFYGIFPFAAMGDISNELAHKVFSEQQETTKSSGSCGSSSSSSSSSSTEVQLYFLRLLFEKRSCMPLGDFVSLLMKCIEINNYSIIDRLEEDQDGTIDEQRLGSCIDQIAAQHVPRAVASLLHGSASSSAPAKIICFLNDMLQDALVGTIYTSTEEEEEAAKNSKFIVSDVNAAPVEWLTLYAHASHVLTIYQTLFSPWIVVDIHNASMAVETAVCHRATAASNTAAATVSRGKASVACVAEASYSATPQSVEDKMSQSLVRASRCAVSLLLNVSSLHTSASSPNHGNSGDSRRRKIRKGAAALSVVNNSSRVRSILHHVASFLTMPVCGLEYEVTSKRLVDTKYAESAATTEQGGEEEEKEEERSNGVRRHVFFESFLNEVCRVWIELDSPSCIGLLQGLGLLLQQSFSYELFDPHRSVIEHLLTVLINDKASYLNRSSRSAHGDLNYETINTMVTNILDNF